jgi:AbrB family looped-hinge helix DNA binding protein
MAVVKMTSKGQTVIPKKIREYMRLQAGDRVDFVIDEKGRVVLKPLDSDVQELKGLLRKPGRKPASLRKMKSDIRQRAEKSS